MKTSRMARAQGSFRVGLLLFFIMLAAFWYGGQGVYTALKNRKPTVIACQDLAKGRPSAHWLVVKDCEMSLIDSAYKIRKPKYASEALGYIEEAYVPLRAPGQDAGSKCYAVVATRDKAILSVLEELRHVKNEASLTKVMASQGTALRPRRDVTGLVRSGIEDSESGQLSNLKGSLAPDFILLAEGQQPNLGMSLGILFVGLLLGGGLIMARRSKSEETTDE